jgi:hypothetical protein
MTGMAGETGTTHDFGEDGTGLPPALKPPAPARPGVARREEGEEEPAWASSEEGGGGLRLRSLSRETVMEMAGSIREEDGAECAPASAFFLGVAIGGGGGEGDGDRRDDGGGRGGRGGGGDEEEEEADGWFPMMTGWLAGWQQEEAAIY